MIHFSTAGVDQQMAGIFGGDDCRDVELQLPLGRYRETQRERRDGKERAPRCCVVELLLGASSLS